MSVSKIILTMLMLTFCAGEMLCQQTFILKNGTVITPEYTTYTRPKKGIGYFTFDEKYIVDLPSIKYVQIDTLRYRLAGLFRGSIQYQKRVLDGSRLDIYNQEFMRTRLYPFGNRESNKIENFIEKDEAHLQTLSYNSVKWAVIDNPTSLKVLNKANKYKWIETISIVIGSIAAIASIQQREFTTLSPLIGISLISLIPIAAVQKPKKRVIHEAIDHYNQSFLALAKRRNLE